MRLTGTLSAFIVAFALCHARQAHAASAWDDIRAFAFDNRSIEDGQDVFSFNAPYRAMDQRRVTLAVAVAFHDGRTVKSITFVVDEDPMPIAATFHFADHRDRADIGVDIRLDHASPVHAIVEASDGKLYMSEHFVKASGLGVCAAPPAEDPVVAARTMGRMHLADLSGRDNSANGTRFWRTASLDIKHPQNTGMQMNQVTMLYIPPRYVSAIEVREGDADLFDVEGSMTLSENPHIEFDYRANGANVLKVMVKDTSKSVWRREFPIGSGS
ncbi:MAG: quinoprotein dehydrogenase-associated SoxYZ-like carrier [Pseudolabrys sp.]|jgi:sulfur-oxidizing protein SoxY